MANRSIEFTVKVIIGRLAVVKTVSGIFNFPVKSLSPSHDGLSLVTVPEFNEQKYQADYLWRFAYERGCGVERTRPLLSAYDQHRTGYLLQNCQLVRPGDKIAVSAYDKNVRTRLGCEAAHLIG